MLLRSIRTVGLRSIDAANLEPCGHFNVLIGKNNSGKSNILAAVRGFFNTIAGGEIVNLRPMFQVEDDFFDRNTKRAIEISCAFEVGDQMISTIIDSMSGEFPAISNATAQIQKAKFLKATTKYFFLPRPFAILTKIGLSEADDTTPSDSYTTIYEIADNLAPQVLERYQQAALKTQEIDIYTTLYRNIDAGDFSRIKNADRTLPIRYYLERYAPIYQFSPELLREVDQILNNVVSFTDFKQFVGEKISAAENERSQIEREPIAGTIYTFGGHQHLIPKYVSGICRSLSEVKVLYQSEHREAIGNADAQRLLSLRVKKGGDKSFQTLKAAVVALIGVEIDAFEDVAAAPGRRPTGEREAKLDVDNFLVQANGSGIREALRLMLDIELDEPDIMLIEEPEVHLHPSLETSVMRYLKKKSDASQIFLTTHSTNFIDSGQFSTIQFIRKAPSTVPFLLTAEQAADVLPSELGLRLSSLFMYEKLVFVEGPSDEDVLREWASIIGCNLSQANVGFVTLGGSRNIKHFSAAKISEFLNRRGVEMWFILDRDETGSEDGAKLQADLGPDRKVRILRVREIENYLLSAAAVSKHIAKRLSKATSQVARPNAASFAPADLANIIASRVEELRDFSLGKALLHRIKKPIYVNPEIHTSNNATEIVESIKQSLADELSALSERSSDFESLISEVTDQFDHHWAANKLQIVPGTEVLEAVLSNFGLSYRKQRDAKDIASKMDATDIPNEVIQILREIAPE
jgi:energy-coupling factor transporter ATP-binding protein EcfA2